MSGMVDLGDTYPLSFNVTDLAGAATNTTGAVLTVTLPDGTTATPALTNSPVGTYYNDYVPTLAGRHVARFVGTSPAVAITDSFDVLPADPGFLFSLDDARSICRIPATDTGNDNLIRQYNAAVTLVVEQLCGKQAQATVTQTFDGGTAGILLPTNLGTISAVSEAGVALTSGDYVLDPRACILYRGSPMAVFSWIPGFQNVSITYTVGSAVIPQNILMGARLILRHFWQGTQQGSRPAFGAPDSSVEGMTNVLGYLIPNTALAFLEASPPQPGFA